MSWKAKNVTLKKSSRPLEDVFNMSSTSLHQNECFREMEKYGERKSLKLRFHSNNTRNEAMICFSTEEEEAQIAITEINTYKGWKTKLYKPIRKSRKFERDKETR